MHSSQGVHCRTKSCPCQKQGKKCTSACGGHKNSSNGCSNVEQPWGLTSPPKDVAAVPTMTDARIKNATDSDPPHGRALNLLVALFYKLLLLRGLIITSENPEVILGFSMWLDGTQVMRKQTTVICVSLLPSVHLQLQNPDLIYLPIPLITLFAGENKDTIKFLGEKWADELAYLHSHPSLPFGKHFIKFKWSLCNGDLGALRKLCANNGAGHLRCNDCSLRFDQPQKLRSYSFHVVGDPTPKLFSKSFEIMYSMLKRHGPDRCHFHFGFWTPPWMKLHLSMQSQGLSLISRGYDPLHMLGLVKLIIECLIGKKVIDLEKFENFIASNFSHTKKENLSHSEWRLVPLLLSQLLGCVADTKYHAPIITIFRRFNALARICYLHKLTVNLRVRFAACAFHLHHLISNWEITSEEISNKLYLHYFVSHMTDAILASNDDSNIFRSMLCEAEEGILARMKRIAASSNHHAPDVLKLMYGKFAWSLCENKITPQRMHNKHTTMWNTYLLTNNEDHIEFNEEETKQSPEVEKRLKKFLKEEGSHFLKRNGNRLTIFFGRW
jgi:hypothetical protein